MSQRRHHRRKGKDPLVAIDGARVRAAIDWKRLSVNGAAARIRISQQTLDSIVRGKTKRCYQSLRDSLAQLLELPAAWLGSEADTLPSLSSWLPYPKLGYTPPLWVDENMRIIRPPAGGDLTQRTTLPPRYQLAAHELSTQITSAWRRDIEQGKRSAKTALSRLATRRWKENPWDRVAMLVTRFVSVFWWRRLFFTSAPMTSRNESNTDDEFATGAASALTTTLEPWFAGRGELDYESLVVALEWASGGFGKNP